jgi:hypothetical protein
MIRARFHADPDDYRPVKFPPPHPYWCSGYAGDGSHSIIVAYADDQEQIREYWPEATEIDAQPAESYVFTDRFAKPSWFQP